MGVDVFEKPAVMNNKELRRLGKAVSSLLTIATEEKRVTCGLRPAINVLEMDPTQILFCVMPHMEDSAKHIQSVLLQAYCYEHDITIIKVDSIEKLKDLVGAADCSCVLIHRNHDNLLCHELELDRLLNSPEFIFGSQPVFKLPAK